MGERGLGSQIEADERHALWPLVPLGLGSPGRPASASVGKPLSPSVKRQNSMKLVEVGRWVVVGGG